MGDLLLPLVVLGLLIFGIVDVITADNAEVRNLPKVVWLLLVVLLPPIGTLAWLLLGRPQKQGWEPARSPGGGAARRPRRTRGPMVAEDPEAILARIEARDELLRQWAEEDRAKQGEPDATPPRRPGEGTTPDTDAG